MTLNPATAKNDEFWINDFKQWLNDRVDRNDYSDAPQEWQKLINDWKNLDSDKSKRTLKELFDRSKHANTYANYFGYTS